MNKQDHPQPIQAWQEAVRQEVGQRPWLTALLTQRGRYLFERFTLFYHRLRAAPRKLRRKLATGAATAALMLALSGAPTPPTKADATIIITPGAAGIAEGDGCSLVEAIINANNGDQTHPECASGSVGLNTIELAGNTYSYTIAYGTDSALPDIASEITIEANGATIARNDGDDMPNMRIIRINSGGNLTLNNATITGGTGVSGGGGIFNYGGTLTLNNSTVSGNTANINGGGIFNYNGTITLNSSTVSENEANRGGGIFNYAYYGTSTVTLNNSTVSGNTANSNGGGIYNRSYDGTSTVTLNNSTVSGNTATNNNGGGIFNGYGASTILRRTIVSGNTAPAGAEISNSGSSVTANAHNVLGRSEQLNSQAFDGFTPGASDVNATSDGTNPTPLTNILNATLADNGGPTLTHALVTGSPAIDIAPAADCAAPPINGVDQRGVTRPQGAGCDAGAVEMGFYLLSVTVTGNGSGQVSSDPTGIDCGEVCELPDLAEGSDVMLTAEASPGSTFTGWSGDIITTTSPITVTMDSIKTITATFALNEYNITLTANPETGGTVTGGGEVTHGDTVTVTANANPGYTFLHWTENGDVVSTAESYSFTAEGNRDLVAHFTADDLPTTHTLYLPLIVRSH